MKRRRPTKVEICVQALLGLLLALLVSDYVNALGESACSAPVPGRTHGCYPWGMMEGPMEGGSWNYANKDIYLRSGMALNVVLGTAILLPFVTPGMWSGLGAVIVVLALGLSQSERLSGLF